MRYNAFISYSHADCGNIAPAIQKALENIGKPWYKLTRNLTVFRDETNLSANPELWNSIKAAIDNSDNLILLASPLAKTSHWVTKEIEYWYSKERNGNLYIVKAKGDIVWNNSTNNIDWDSTTCLPTNLDSKFQHEPLWIDLKQYIVDENVDYKSAGFTTLMTKIIGGIVGKPPREIESDELSKKRKTTTALVISICTFVLCVFLVYLFYIQKQSNIKLAELNERNSIANNLIAKGNENRDEDINKTLLYYAYAYTKYRDTTTLNIIKEFYSKNSFIDTNRVSIDSINLFFSKYDKDVIGLDGQKYNTNISELISCEFENNTLKFIDENDNLLASIYLNDQFINLKNNPDFITLDKFIKSPNSTHAYVNITYGHFSQSFIFDIISSKIIEKFDEESGKTQTGFRINPTTVHFDNKGRYYIVGFENGGIQMIFLESYDSLHDVYNFVNLNSEDSYSSEVTSVNCYNRLIFVGYNDGAFAIYRNEESRYNDNPNGSFLSLIKRIKLYNCSLKDSDDFYKCGISKIHFITNTVFIKSYEGTIYKMQLNKTLNFKDITPEKIVNQLNIEDLSKEDKLKLKIVKE